MESRARYRDAAKAPRFSVPGSLTERGRFAQSKRVDVVEESFPARNPQVVHRRLADGEVVLLHLETGSYHELNPVAGAIWELLDGERGASEIATELRTQVDDPPDNFKSIVEGFLAELGQRGLIC